MTGRRISMLLYQQNTSAIVTVMNVDLFGRPPGCARTRLNIVEQKLFIEIFARSIQCPRAVSRF